MIHEGTAVILGYDDHVTGCVLSSFYLFPVRGGPLDILGGGCQIKKKNSCKELDQKKKNPASAWRKKKKFVQLHGID